MPCANNKDADQPVHPRCLISVVVIRCLDIIIHLVPTSEISSLYIASRCSWAGWFKYYLVANPRRQVFSWRSSNRNGNKHNARRESVVCSQPSSTAPRWAVIYECFPSLTFSVWAASWQNQQNGMCAQRRLRSAWASAQSDQSLHCALNG